MLRKKLPAALDQLIVKTLAQGPDHGHQIAAAILNASQSQQWQSDTHR